MEIFINKIILDDFDEKFGVDILGGKVDQTDIKSYITTKLEAVIKERDEFWKQRMREFGEGLKKRDVEVNEFLTTEPGVATEQEKGYNRRNHKLNAQIDQELKKLK